SVMVIRHPERFGLSQLHQLRGRVGRGAHQSYCILVHPVQLSQESRDRLAVMERTDDGFVIAEEDLALRGAGEFLGSRQHGASQFEFADLSRDTDILLEARAEAERIVSSSENTAELLNLFEEKFIRSGEVNGSRIKRSLSLIS
ncbi:MAG: ATP-dependent DNA helicase RecG, partial [Spirochaetota bacterium]